MNPAVTLGMLIAGGVNVGVAVLYFFVQLIGAIAGAACVLVCKHLIAYTNHTSILTEKSMYTVLVVPLTHLLV